MRLRLSILHCTALLLGLTTPAGVLGQVPGGDSFTIFINGRPIGTESVAISRSGEGWAIRGTGRLEAPVDLDTRRFEMRYANDGNPLELINDAILKADALYLHVVFREDQAQSESRRGIETTRDADPVSPGVVVLSDRFFGSYEALAARLPSLSPGAEVPVYFAPQSEIPVRLESVTTEQLQTAGRNVEARRHRITFLRPGAPFDAEVWTDPEGRLLRLSLPSESVEVLRNDIASVSTRRQTVTRPGDEQVRIGASGFTLSATLSMPPPPPPPGGHPAVILVPGSAAMERDLRVGDVPIYGQLAGGLADAGFLVVRYDRRGIGQSGGRAESATLGDYAEDVRDIVDYLKDRRDVNDRRIAVVGHSEGGWIALEAAAREDDIAAVVLAEVAGVSGAELVLEQQQRALERLNLTEQERTSRVELQKRINEAVVSGQGWDELGPFLREQADTPFFRSLLRFKPAEAIQDMEQPILILHAELDRQVPEDHAARLLELAQARERGASELVTLEGLNHLLIPAVTGGVEEYPSLTDKTLAPTVGTTIASWLEKALPAR